MTWKTNFTQSTVTWTALMGTSLAESVRIVVQPSLKSFSLNYALLKRELSNFPEILVELTRKMFVFFKKLAT